MESSASMVCTGNTEMVTAVGEPGEAEGRGDRVDAALDPDAWLSCDRTRHVALSPHSKIPPSPPTWLFDTLCWY